MNESTTLIAIDPGASGGIACWNNSVIDTHVMPDTEGDIVSLLRRLITDPDSTVVFMEQVGGFIGRPQPGSAMFRFGQNYGFLLGCLQTMGVRVELVRPQKWQQLFSLGKSTYCASKSEWKNKLKALAQRLYPAAKVTLATADALLIMEYGLRQRRNTEERQAA